MADLAQQLSDAMKAPVTDATGIAGKFDFDLQTGDPLNPDAAVSTLPAALRSQLGLELVKGRGAYTVFRILGAALPGGGN